MRRGYLRNVCFPSVLPDKHFGLHRTQYTLDTQPSFFMPVLMSETIWWEL